ncbi:MAG: HNH endonuclease signature motif containing protein [Acidobacteriota bacterium]
MSSQINRHGLTRASMTEEVRRAVRQRCGFGCIICGSAFVEYDHFEPEFADALVHDPDHIILLCMHHHGLKTKSAAWLSADEIRLAAAAPAAHRAGHAAFDAPPARSHPTVVIGELTCIRAKSILTVDGFSILSIREPEEQGGPFRINAFLSNSSGTEMLEIVDNEVRTSTSNWDITLKGATLKIWEASRKAGLVLRFEENRIVVERLDMAFRGLEISVHEGQPTKLTRAGRGFCFYGATFTDSEVVANFDESDMFLGKGGTSYVESLVMGGGSVRAAVPEKPTVFGGMAHCRIPLPPNTIGLSSFGRAGLVANMHCAFPANDDCFAPLA